MESKIETEFSKDTINKFIMVLLNCKCKVHVGNNVVVLIPEPQN